MPIKINELIIRANVVEQGENNVQNAGSASPVSAQSPSYSPMTSVFDSKRRRER